MTIRRFILTVLILVIILILIALGIFFFARGSEPATTTVIQKTPASETSTRTGASVPPEITEHAQYYDIDAKEPAQTPLSTSVGAPADSAAVSLMADYVANVIQEFKEQGDFDNLTNQEISEMGFDQGRKESLIVTYQQYASARTVSYVFTVNEDTLGAHPNTTYESFTFDTTTGTSLALSDLFNPDTNYIQLLSSASFSALKQTLGANADPNEIAAGTAPSEQNFSVFALDGTSLNIIFPPYQVAPYALGTQTVQIPFSQLSSFLKPNYRS